MLSAVPEDRERLPPKIYAYPVLWRASVASLNCRVTVFYVWATADGYEFGRTKPSEKTTVATFYKDRMLFCIWGDEQYDDILIEEIEAYDGGFTTELVWDDNLLEMPRNVPQNLRGETSQEGELPGDGGWDGGPRRA